MRTALATTLVLLAAGCASAPPRQPPPPPAPPGAPEVRAVRVADPPMVDGIANDAAWADAPEVEVRLPDAQGPDSCRLRAVIHRETLYLLVSWKDSEENRVSMSAHTGADPPPWGYSQVGDLVEVALPIEGPFTGDPLAPASSEMDLWRWDAMRDWSGHARDGCMTYTGTEAGQGTPRSPEVRDDQGTAASRGTPPTGSAADVLARGRWVNGEWTVEMARALRTGHPGDRDLGGLAECPMAIHIVDRSKDSKGWPGRMRNSPVLCLLLPPPEPDDRQGPFPEPRGGSGYGR